MRRKVTLPLHGLLAAGLLLAAGCMNGGQMQPLLSGGGGPRGPMRPLLAARTTGGDPWADNGPAMRALAAGRPMDGPAPANVRPVAARSRPLLTEPPPPDAPLPTARVGRGWPADGQEESVLPPGPRMTNRPAPANYMLPHEKVKVSFPDYVIEPPDILNINVIRAVPRGPYRIAPLDALSINVPEALKAEPIAGIYPVSPEGRVTLGATYGSIQVVDMTLEQAQEAIRKYLAENHLTKPHVTVSLVQSGGVQQVRGEHLVAQDGTVSLGTYGRVRVTGMTIDDAKAAIEQHLSQYLSRPEVSLDVFSYNSKHYYVITDGAGFGEQIYRLPATGNETVLDALSQIGGLPPVASKGRIWVARPAPPGAGCQDQILPVNYCAVTRGGQAGTNYQLLPGDRVYVMASPLITGTTWLGRALAPIENLLGVSLLGSGTVTGWRTATGPLGVGAGGVGP